MAPMPPMHRTPRDELADIDSVIQRLQLRKAVLEAQLAMQQDTLVMPRRAGWPIRRETTVPALH